MEKTRLIQKAALLLPAVREKRPLIHCITNYVAANDSANLLLAVGASPIMADCASEASEIAGKSAGVLLNLGIPNPDKLRAMRLAGETANLLHRPVVLDPVGAGASAYRREAVCGLLNRVQARIIRANAGEIQTLAGEESVSEGVDAVGTVHHTETLAKAVAERYECIAAVTGETDVITDGKRTVRILNGHPALSVLTGSGCMTSALTAAFMSASDDALAAAVAGIAFMGICGELAAERSELPGSFHAALLDAAAAMTPECFLEKIRLE